MRVKWEVKDGYVGKSRPQYTEIDKRELADYATLEEKREFIWNTVQDDFENRITFDIYDDIDELIGKEMS